MKKIVCLILGLFLGLTVSASALELDSSEKLAAAEAPKVELKAEFVPGELLIKYRSTAEKASVDSLNAEMGLTLKKTLAGIGASLVTLPAGMDVQAAMDHFKDDPRIEYVEPNYYIGSVNNYV